MKKFIFLIIFIALMSVNLFSAERLDVELSCEEREIVSKQLGVKVKSAVVIVNDGNIEDSKVFYTLEDDTVKVFGGDK